MTFWGPGADWKSLGRQPGEDGRNEGPSQGSSHIPPNEWEPVLFFLSFNFFFREEKKKKKHISVAFCVLQTIALSVSVSVCVAVCSSPSDLELTEFISEG